MIDPETRTAIGGRYQVCLTQVIEMKHVLLISTIILMALAAIVFDTQVQAAERGSRCLQVALSCTSEEGSNNESCKYRPFGTPCAEHSAIYCDGSGGQDVELRYCVAIDIGVQCDEGGDQSCGKQVNKSCVAGAAGLCAVDPDDPGVPVNDEDGNQKDCNVKSCNGNVS